MKTFALSALPVLMFLSILVLAVTIWVRYPPVSPVRFFVENGDVGRIVCPGEKMHVRVKIDIRKPIVVRFNFSVIDSTGAHNISGTQSESPKFIFPEKSSYYEYFSWKAPDISAGSYRYVIAAIPDNEPRKTSMLSVPFEIGDHCDERN